VVRRVFVDTSVLFPFSVMDLFFALREDGVHQVLWIDELLEEWERVIVREQRRTAETARSVTAAIREFFADCRILPESYATLIAQMPGNDPDDHVHMAAAVAAGVGTLVTANRAAFPAVPLRVLGVEVMGPDAYLAELFDDLPFEVTGAVLRIAGERTRPPMTPRDLLAALRGTGLRAFPDRVERRLQTADP
jgi:predicted nucleic acid-binding protein